MARIFKDLNGRDWAVKVNTNSINRGRELANFDLLSSVEEKNQLQKLINPMVFVPLLYAILKPDADAASITADQFAEAVGDGDVLDKAFAAVMESLADFSHPQTRKTILAAVAKMRQVMEKAADIIVTEIESPELEAKALKALQRNLAESSSTDSQVSSA